MIINSILIVDVKNSEANKYKFDNKANLIVSEGNTQGKSSLLKSIYYALGLDIKSFPSGWNIDDMILQINVTENNNKYLITRFKNKFKINNSDFMTGLPYSVFLQKFLGIDMQLPAKITNELKQAYSSAVLLPFFIDQDSSWQGIPYKSVTNTINQYNNVPTSIFEYIFKISDEEIQNLVNEKTKINNKRNELTRQITVLDEYKTSEIESLNMVSNIAPIDAERLKSQIEYYLKMLNEYNEIVKKHKLKIMNFKNELNDLEQELSELTKLLALNRKEYRSIQ